MWYPVYYGGDGKYRVNRIDNWTQTLKEAKPIPGESKGICRAPHQKCRCGKRLFLKVDSGKEVLHRRARHYKKMHRALSAFP